MQLEFFDVPSPCVEVCQSNEKGYCLGCMRTRKERNEWMKFDNDNKQKVIKLCIQRKKRQNNKMSPQKIEVVAAQNDQQKIEQPSLLDPPEVAILVDDKDLDFGDFEL